MHSPESINKEFYPTNVKNGRDSRTLRHPEEWDGGEEEDDKEEEGEEGEQDGL